MNRSRLPLTPTQQVKIQILRDILACKRLSKSSHAEARKGLDTWEERARGYGWTSLADWEAAR